MNRKEFFKKLGLGALVVAVAPKVLAKKEYVKCEDHSHLEPIMDRVNKLIADGDLKIRMQDWHYTEGSEDEFRAINNMINDKLFPL